MTRSGLCAWFVSAVLAGAAWGGEAIFVESGQPKLVKEEGGPWTRQAGFLECAGTGPILFAGQALGDGDFRIAAMLTIFDLKDSAASFTFDGASHFGFEGGKGQPFVEGPLFGGKAAHLPDLAGLMPVGQPFRLEVVRRGERVTFSIDGQAVYERAIGAGPVGDFGFRPWRSRMRVHEFSAEGNLVASSLLAGWADGLASEPVDVFTSGGSDYHTFRIPSVVVTSRNTVLAFCEGRKLGGGDAGDIDLVLRRSTDLGKTWSDLQVVWNDENNTCGNPCPVVDQQTGRIWLALTWNLGSEPEGQIMKGTTRHPRRPFMTYSDDDGAAWAKPVEMPHLRQEHWRWYATGPDKGIQLTHGQHAGRLVIPCNHSDHSDPQKHPYRSHVIYSDDHGQTWKLGGLLDERTNESTIVESSDGSILDNMRSYHGQHRRAVAISRDGGESWGPVTLDEQLVEPVCQASILRYSWPDPPSPSALSRIVFSNPASSTARKQLTLRLSYDEGRTWAKSRVLYGGSAAYSCLAKLPDGTIGVLFERDGYRRISFARVDVSWLESSTEEALRVGS
jgi:sialidase-1